MTDKQQRSEILYQASIAPFKAMLRNGVITAADYGIIDILLCQKYSPIFVDIINDKVLDNNAKQS